VVVGGGVIKSSQSDRKAIASGLQHE